jgi:multiple sugar transport system substrate-binding protein
MAQERSEEQFSELAAGFRAGRIGRRQFIAQAAKLGISVTLLSRVLAGGSARAADDDVVESSPDYPNESPITKERIAFLKSKPYKGTTINVLVLKATVGDGLKYWVPKWEEETGGKVNVAEVPIDTLHQQIFSDLSTGLGKYDTYMTGAWFYGDFFVPKEPYIIPIEPFLKDPKYPKWNPDDWIPAMRNLYSWQGKVYGVLFDGDAQILYYRKDVLSNPDNQKKFKDKLGYDLPNPPKTTKEMHDVATFFTGWDWNGDGQNDWGISLHAKVNEQGFFHFLTLAAPYVCSPNNKYFWFNPDTMKPLINSEGHVRALEDYVKFLPCGPKEAVSWTLGQGWNLFLAGHAVMEPTWGDLPTFAQDPKESKVQGKMGAAIIPGTTEAYDPIKGQWDKFDLNSVGNVNGGSWHCVISRFSKKKEATYDFLAFMATRKNALYNCTHGFTGVQPGMKFEYFPPVGTGSVAEWKEQGWNEDDAKVYLDAYYKNLSLPVQESYLRIPGAAEYWHELDVRVSAVLAGQTQPKAALDDCATAWERITERYGRDKQKKLYAESFGG